MRPHLRPPTHAALLVVLVVLIVASPLVPAESSGSSLLVELLFDLVLLAGVRSVGPSKHRVPFLLLTVLTLGIRWGEELTGSGILDTSALAITAVWLLYAIWIIVGHLFRRRDVTLNTIFGAIVTYLLIAIAFSMVFQIIELERPGSFSGLPDTTVAHRNELNAAVMYYSLICFTTMGFGDIVPVSELARMVSAIAGVFGQLYLAVMIARLVGLHIAHMSRND
ncbi:MAG: potassium channel family protein [Myxococcota bacterium]